MAVVCLSPTWEQQLLKTDIDYSSKPEREVISKTVSGIHVPYAAGAIFSHHLTKGNQCSVSQRPSQEDSGTNDGEISKYITPALWH